MNAIFISDFLKLDNELSEIGMFDAIINRDSHFFINILRLKKAHIKELMTFLKISCCYYLIRSKKMINYIEVHWKNFIFQK